MTGEKYARIMRDARRRELGKLVIVAACLTGAALCGLAWWWIS